MSDVNLSQLSESIAQPSLNRLGQGVKGKSYNSFVRKQGKFFDVKFLPFYDADGNLDTSVEGFAICTLAPTNGAYRVWNSASETFELVPASQLSDDALLATEIQLVTYQANKLRIKQFGLDKSAVTRTNIGSFFVAYDSQSEDMHILQFSRKQNRYVAPNMPSGLSNVLMSDIETTLGLAMLSFTNKLINHNPLSDARKHDSNVLYYAYEESALKARELRKNGTVTNADGTLKVAQAQKRIDTLIDTEEVTYLTQDFVK